MIKKILLLVLFFATLLPTSPALAIQSCACTIRISGGARVGQGAGVEVGPGCDINQTINFELENTYSAGDVLNEISFFDCPFKAAAGQFMDLDQSMQVTALNCLGANLIPSGSQQGFDYSISCSLSDEDGIAPGGGGRGNGGNNFDPDSGVDIGTFLQGSKGKQQGYSSNKPAETTRLVNPIGGTEQNPEGMVDTRIIFGKAIKVTLGFLGTFTLAVFVYGGFLWLTSAGNSDKVQKGAQTMLYAVVGLFIIFGAYGILNTIITGIRGGASENGPTITAGDATVTPETPCTETPIPNCKANILCAELKFIDPNDGVVDNKCIDIDDLEQKCLEDHADCMEKTMGSACGNDQVCRDAAIANRASMKPCDDARDACLENGNQF